MALNANLPHEIRVLRVNHAPADFHARFSAQGKVYVYRIWNGPVLHPLEIGKAWHVPGLVDLDLLRAGTDILTGTHDFAGFAASRGKAERDTVRTITEMQVRQRGPLLTLRVEGPGFLYKMVRILTGSLVRCAQGRAELDWLRDLLKSKDAAKSNFAAPAEGLYLERVLY
jgi:tRNA pseudouridine38-40 synthase